MFYGKLLSRKVYGAYFSFCRKKIQAGKDGHCSIEDAKVCMQLVQLKLKSGNFCCLDHQFINIFSSEKRH